MKNEKLKSEDKPEYRETSKFCIYFFIFNFSVYNFSFQNSTSMFLVLL